MTILYFCLNLNHDSARNYLFFWTANVILSNFLGRISSMIVGIFTQKKDRYYYFIFENMITVPMILLTGFLVNLNNRNFFIEIISFLNPLKHIFEILI